MIKVIIIRNSSKEIELSPETMTLSEFCNAHGIKDGGISRTTVNDLDLGDYDGDERLDSISEDNEILIVSATMMKNAADGVTIKVNGHVVTVRSTLKLEDIKLEKQLGVDMQLYDEAGQPYFKVDIAKPDETGTFNEYGIVWSNRPSRSGLAELSFGLEFDDEASDEEIKNTLFSLIGGPLKKLNEIERKMRSELELVHHDRNEVLENINIADD